MSKTRKPTAWVVNNPTDQPIRRAGLNFAPGSNDVATLSAAQLAQIRGHGHLQVSARSDTTTSKGDA